MTKDDDATIKPPKGDYGVGHGKPPKEHQFKKGQSGNPKGRPKKKATGVDVISILNKPVRANINGQEVEMQAFEAGLRQLVKKAFSEKNSRALIDLLKEFEVHGLFKVPEVIQGGGVIVAPPGITPEEWIKQEMEKEEQKKKKRKPRAKKGNP